MKNVLISIGFILLIFGHNLLVGYIGAMAYHDVPTTDPFIGALQWSFSAGLLVLNVIYYEIFIKEN